MKTKIYISGGSGLVGKNIIENLDNSKYEILHPSSSELNLLNTDAVKEFFKHNKPDIVIHCAGKVGGIQANMINQFDYFTENILMGLNVVKSAKEAGVRRFLNLSSSCAYPAKAPNPLTEDLIFTGKFEKTNEGYAIAKTAILKMCGFITSQFNGFFYKTIIPCNLYGKYDKFGESNSHMIPAVIKKLYFAKINKLESVEIWGTGKSRREEMFASDFAIIISEILDRFDEMPNIMNIGSGCDYSINDYYKIIAKVIGYNGKFTHDLTKPEGMQQKLMDVSKQKSLGLKLKYSLEEGIKETYEYFLKNEL